MNSVPLEIKDPKNFDKLDDVQKKLICEYDALDLILLENANEILRVFMQGGDNSENNNIENLLEEMGKENENSIFFRSDTVDIYESSKRDRDTGKNIWQVTKDKKNKDTLKTYLSNVIDKIKNSNINNNTIFYTVVGLNLTLGGHYGSIVCDLKNRKVYIFDSMSGDFGYDQMKSSTEGCFMYIAEYIFKDKEVLTLLKEKINLEENISFNYEPVYISYILQPTGGFTEIISPDLEFMEDEYEQMEINIQHSESQNHFCYIWSCLFCHIYLRGKIELFNKFLEDCKGNSDKMIIENNDRIIPLVIIKKYILGFVNLLENKLPKIDKAFYKKYKKFFFKHFPRIWSNHEDIQTLNFKLYKINYQENNKMFTNIFTCLNNVLDVSNSLTKIKKTNHKEIRRELQCLKKEDLYNISPTRISNSISQSKSKSFSKALSVKSLPNKIANSKSKKNNIKISKSYSRKYRSI